MRAIYIWRLTNVMFFELVTPCIRPENLGLIADSICIPSGGFRWWIVLDGVELSDEVRRVLPPEAVVLHHTDVRSVSGNAQRNHALDMMGNQSGHWVYFLDDDTVMHPEWWSWISAGSSADWISFGMQRSDGTLYTDGFARRKGRTDTGNHVFHRPLIGDKRWSLAAYGADGQFIESLAESPCSFRLINRPLSCYNAIERLGPLPEPVAWRDAFRRHNGPVFWVVEPSTDPAFLIAAQVSAALLADDTGGEVFFYGLLESASPFRGVTKPSEHRWAMGFRNNRMKSLPVADNPMHIAVLNRPELFDRLVVWMADNPEASISVTGADYFHTLPLYENTVLMARMGAELRSGWQLFPLDEPLEAGCVMVDSAAWTGSAEQVATLQGLKGIGKRWVWSALQAGLAPCDMGVTWEVWGPEANYWARWRLMVQAETFVTWGGAMGFVTKLLRNEQTSIN
ncbi:glycosyltransferase family 2 protein [bacterium]|nr:glycosyltransferase family 2 protein [bacterium]